MKTLILAVVVLVAGVAFGAEKKPVLTAEQITAIKQLQMQMGQLKRLKKTEEAKKVQQRIEDIKADKYKVRGYMNKIEMGAEGKIPGFKVIQVIDESTALVESQDILCLLKDCDTTTMKEFEQYEMQNPAKCLYQIKSTTTYKTRMGTTRKVFVLTELEGYFVSL